MLKKRHFVAINSLHFRGSWSKVPIKNLYDHSSIQVVLCKVAVSSITNVLILQQFAEK